MLGLQVSVLSDARATDGGVRGNGAAAAPVLLRRRRRRLSRRGGRQQRLEAAMRRRRGAAAGCEVTRRGEVVAVGGGEQFGRRRVGQQVVAVGRQQRDARVAAAGGRARPEPVRERRLQRVEGREVTRLRSVARLTVTHPSTKRARRALTSFIRRTPQITTSRCNRQPRVGIRKRPTRRLDPAVMRVEGREVT